MTDNILKENKTKQTPNKRYRKLPTLFFLITIMYTLWVVVVITGIYYLNMEYRWAYLTMDQWIIGGCIIIAFFLVIDFILFFKTSRYIKPQTQPSTTSQPLIFKGKQLQVFTYPAYAKGGIFSRTYIPLDEDTILQIRTQMIPAEQLWGKIQP